MDVASQWGAGVCYEGAGEEGWEAQGNRVALKG
jgi:hypothetical protein